MSFVRRSKALIQPSPARGRGLLVALLVLAYFAVAMSLRPKLWWFQHWPKLLLEKDLMATNLQELSILYDTEIMYILVEDSLFLNKKKIAVKS